jgi:hypothetical protein
LKGVWVLSTAAEPKESPNTAKEVFEKYYVLAVLETRRPVVTLDEMLELVESGEDSDAITDFVRTDEYSDWVVYSDPFDGDDIVAVPSLAKELREQGLGKVVRWLLYKSGDMNMINELVTDATLRCTAANEFVEDILKLASKHFAVEEDRSGYNKSDYTGTIVYRVYDGDKHVGTIVKKLWYCNRCMCSPFYDSLGCYENFVAKCVYWSIGEPPKE